MHWIVARPSRCAGVSQARRLWQGRGMTRAFGTAPSLAEIEALALAALARLPERFAAHLGGVAVLVEDFADP